MKEKSNASALLAPSLSANLGADASESGSRHDRVWEQTRSPLGAETPTSIGNEKAGCSELCPSITSRAALWPAMRGSAFFIMASSEPGHFSTYQKTNFDLGGALTKSGVIA